MVNTPQKFMDDPVWDQLMEERDAWRDFAMGGPNLPCRHPDPSPDHVADLPLRTRITRTEPTTEIRQKRKARAEA